MYCPKCGAATSPGLAYCGTCGAALGGAPAAAPAAASPVYTVPAYGAPVAQRAWDYATWGTRAIGYIIDFLLIGAGMAILYLILAALSVSMFHLTGGEDVARGFCCMFIMLFPMATLFVGLYNSVYLIAQRGYSIGQGVV